MGPCCEGLFQKEEVHGKESLLRFLQNKITLSYHTQNDLRFTYYLHVFDHHRNMQKILEKIKSQSEHPSNNSNNNLKTSQISFQLQQFNFYMRAFTNKDSELATKIKEDEQKIKRELQMHHLDSNSQQACMIKLEIQGIELVSGINRIGIITDAKHSGSNINQYLIVGCIKNQKVYRQLIFPTCKNSQLKIVTDPISASVTIDLEDVAKNQVICGTFVFKDKEEEYGFIALRLQYVTRSAAYQKQKMDKLRLLEKELKICLGKDSLQKLNEYQGQYSVKQSPHSSHVSDYPNQYRV